MSAETSAAARLRKALDAPASMMGGITAILSLEDVTAVLAENDRLRAIIRVNALRHDPSITHEQIDEVIRGAR